MNNSWKCKVYSCSARRRRRRVGRQANQIFLFLSLRMCLFVPSHLTQASTEGKKQGWLGSGGSRGKEWGVLCLRVILAHKGSPSRNGGDGRRRQKTGKELFPSAASSWILNRQETFYKKTQKQSRQGLCHLYFLCWLALLFPFPPFPLSMVGAWLGGSIVFLRAEIWGKEGKWDWKSKSPDTSKGESQPTPLLAREMDF